MKQIDVAIAIVIRDDLVLICQRRDGDTFGGYWEFPGGKREPGETTEDCLRRELIEELGMELDVIDAFPPIEHDYPQLRLRLHPFLCGSPSRTPRPMACQRIEWVPRRNLSAYTFPPANAPLIEHLMGRRSAEIAPAPLGSADPRLHS